MAVPVCKIDYYGRWCFNALLLPVCLMFLVWFTWQTEEYDWWSVVTCALRNCKRKNEFEKRKAPDGESYTVEEFVGSMKEWKDAEERIAPDGSGESYTKKQFEENDYSTKWKDAKAIAEPAIEAFEDLVSPASLRKIFRDHVGESVANDAISSPGLSRTNTLHGDRFMKDNQLTWEQVGVILTKLGNRLTEEHLSAVMSEMDGITGQKQDHLASFEELEKWLALDKEAGAYDEKGASMHSDYYLGFFLCYPTMTQTYFAHFNCRRLSDDVMVLEADYSVLCGADWQWNIVAVFSAVFIAAVSFGVPIGMFYVMQKFMDAEMQKADHLKKSRVVAYRDFHREYGFMAGDYKSSAYYAECIDLVRKCFMTGMLVLLAPGTVIQSFCSVLLAMFFLAVQVKLWPYPHLGANMLKMFTDLQIFLVTLVGLVLRISPEELQRDPLSRGFVLCVLQRRECGNRDDLLEGEVVEQTMAASFCESHNSTRNDLCFRLLVIFS